MSKPIVIALHGPQRSGKNTVVDIIKSYRSRAKGFALSTRIKMFTHDILGKLFVEDDKDDPILNGHTPRDAYIYIGNMDQYDPGLWARLSGREVEKWCAACHMNSYGEIENPGVVAVIESIGKQPQWWALLEVLHKTCDVVLVGVERPGHEYLDNRTPIFDYCRNYTIVNDGTPSDLNGKVIHLLRLVEDRPHNRAWTTEQDSGTLTPLGPTLIN